MTVLFGPKATLTVSNGDPQTIIDLQVSLDEGNAPFLVASAVIARPAVSVTFDQFDPTRRLPVKISVQYSPSATLSLTSMLVHERSFDPSDNTVGLTLVSREMLLTSFSPLSDVSYLASQNSVRSISEQVVRAAALPGASVQLVGNAADKAFYVFSEEQNRFPNPDIGTLSGFAATTNNSLTRVQATGSQAAYGYAVRSAASAVVSRIDIQYTPSAPIPVSASDGTQYTLSLAARASAGNSTTLFMQFFNNAGTIIQTTSKTLGTIPTTFGTRYTVTATAPPNTSGIAFVLRDGAASRPSGSFLDAAQVMVNVGTGTDPTAGTSTLLPYFSGATADNASYHYGWTGDANASESFRTPLTVREPETLYWRTGTTGYDYLKPILDASGLRLFLREDGVWCLADNNYSVPGQVAMQSGVNLYEGVENVSLGDTDSDGFPMNADAVVLNYEWDDPVFGRQTAQDKSSASGYSRPYVTTINKPYPGPGQANYLLTRLQARKATVAVSGRLDFTARPGMVGLISLPNRPAYTGYVSRVDFDLKSNTMRVTTKGLINVLPGSIGATPIGKTIGQMTGTIAQWPN